jgi:hypothetical protein
VLIDFRWPDSTPVIPATAQPARIIDAEPADGCAAGHQSAAHVAVPAATKGPLRGRVFLLAIRVVIASNPAADAQRLARQQIAHKSERRENNSSVCVFRNRSFTEHPAQRRPLLASHCSANAFRFDPNRTGERPARAPNRGRGEVNGGQEVARGFIVASGDRTKLLEFGEEVLEQVAPCRGGDRICGARGDRPSADHGGFAGGCQWLDNPLIGIKRLIGQSLTICISMSALAGAFALLGRRR